ncbi:MAG: CDGSH iron-sulfur domain-containing protein, partial [Candidatus Micrarchaeota archaeon]|nr:CDGSH iron-sulfur domain-containing protein [Candidatus Micrarchaeota archaeon]
MAKEEKPKCKVTISKNGPYIISGNLPLQMDLVARNRKDDQPEEWKKGKTFPKQEAYSLCRCGNSNSKPYCDGHHISTKFDGTETAATEKYKDCAKKITGPGLILRDNEELCSLGRFCHRVGGTWNLTRNSFNDEARDLAIRQAGNCPSGRLVACDKETGKGIEPNLDQSIGITEDPEEGSSGPLWLKGKVTL